MSTYAEMSIDELSDEHFALCHGSTSERVEAEWLWETMERRKLVRDAVLDLAQELDDAGLVVVPASLWDRACAFWPFFAMACVADGVASPPPTREASLTQGVQGPTRTIPAHESNAYQLPLGTQPVDLPVEEWKWPKG